jgi:hypothetical protein
MHTNIRYKLNVWHKYMDKFNKPNHKIRMNIGLVTVLFFFLRFLMQCLFLLQEMSSMSSMPFFGVSSICWYWIPLLKKWKSEGRNAASVLCADVARTYCQKFTWLYQVALASDFSLHLLSCHSRHGQETRNYDAVSRKLARALPEPHSYKLPLFCCIKFILTSVPELYKLHLTSLSRVLCTKHIKLMYNGEVAWQPLFHAENYLTDFNSILCSGSALEDVWWTFWFLLVQYQLI